MICAGGEHQLDGSFAGCFPGCRHFGAGFGLQRHNAVERECGADKQPIVGYFAHFHCRTRSTNQLANHPFQDRLLFGRRRRYHEKRRLIGKVCHADNYVDILSTCLDKGVTQPDDRFRIRVQSLVESRIVDQFAQELRDALLEFGERQRLNVQSSDQKRLVVRVCADHFNRRIWWYGQGNLRSEGECCERQQDGEKGSCPHDHTPVQCIAWLVSVVVGKSLKCIRKLTIVAKCQGRCKVVSLSSASCGKVPQPHGACDLLLRTQRNLITFSECVCWFSFRRRKLQYSLSVLHFVDKRSAGDWIQWRRALL